MIMPPSGIRPYKEPEVLNVEVCANGIFETTATQTKYRPFETLKSLNVTHIKYKEALEAWKEYVNQTI